MSYTRSSININTVLESLSHLIAAKVKHYQTKTYDYSDLISGTDYVFELTDDVNQYYMTAQFKGIKQGDYIIIRPGSYVDKYLVEEIDYYSEPPGMWIALLKKSN